MSNQLQKNGGVPYIKGNMNIESGEVVRIITNEEAAKKEYGERLDAILSFSFHPAMIALFEYLHYTLEEGKCPFVPLIHNNNLYFSSLYNKNEGKEINIANYFSTLQPNQEAAHQIIQALDHQKTLKFSDYLTVFNILSDPSLTDKSFVLKLERKLMKEKSLFVNNGFLGGAMLSDPRGGAKRTSNPQDSSTDPIGIKNKHPFQVEGYNMVAYRKFYSGNESLQFKKGGIPLEHKKSNAVILGDLGSLRTLQDIQNFIKTSTPSKTSIHLFINHLKSKPVEDLYYLENCLQEKKKPEDILQYVYEQYFMHVPEHCVKMVQYLLKFTYPIGIKILKTHIINTQKSYNKCIKELEVYLQDENHNRLQEQLNLITPKITYSSH